MLGYTEISLTPNQTNFRGQPLVANMIQMIDTNHFRVEVDLVTGVPSDLEPYGVEVWSVIRRNVIEELSIWRE